MPKDPNEVVKVRPMTKVVMELTLRHDRIGSCEAMLALGMNVDQRAACVAIDQLLASKRFPGWGWEGNVLRFIGGGHTFTDICDALMNLLERNKRTWGITEIAFSKKAGT